MDAPGKSRLTMEQFCGRACAFVRFSPDHGAITAELTGHMEEHRDALLETRPHMPLWDAETAAVREHEAGLRFFRTRDRRFYTYAARWSCYTAMPGRVKEKIAISTIDHYGGKRHSTAEERTMDGCTRPVLAGSCRPRAATA